MLVSNNQVHFCAYRYPVNWGGFNSVLATLELMRSAFNDNQYDYFVILQGLEYPIKSNREIEQFFNENYGTEFIKAQDISHTTDKNQTFKFHLNYDNDNLSFVRKPKQALFRKMYMLGFPLKFKENYCSTAKGDKLTVYQGCAQFAVTKNLVEYILDFANKNNLFNYYFKKVFAPDESYFHTIIYNSQYKLKTPYKGPSKGKDLVDFENLTYFEYPKLVRAFKHKSEYSELSKRDFIFFKKANSESVELLDYIDFIHKETNS